MGNDAEAVIGEEDHLGIPVVGRQRPAMTEHDRLTLAPILEEDLDAVFCRDGGHGNILLLRGYAVIPGHASSRGPGIWRLEILRCAIAHHSSRFRAPRNDELESA